MTSSRTTKPGSIESGAAGNQLEPVRGRPRPSAPLAAALVAALLLARPGVAQGETQAEAGDAAPATPGVEEIVVSAARTGQPASAIAGTVTILARELVQQRAAISDDLASVLAATVPGFAPGSQKLAGRGETLRGRNPLYLIDGIPQHNALRDGQRDGHTIDLDFVERIEVINGSNAIQGVGATGGVVNIVTRAAQRGAGWTTTLRGRLTSADDFDADSFGYKTSVLTSAGFERGGVMVGAALHERGLFFDGSGDAVGLYPTQGDIMDSRSLSLFASGELDLTDTTTVSLLFNDFDLERNGDFRSVAGDRALGIPTGTEKGDPSALVGDPARTEATNLSLTLREGNLFGGALEAQLYGQRFRALFEGGTFGDFFRLTPDGGPFLDQSEIVSDKVGVRLTWNRTVDALALDATGGLDWYRDDSSQKLARSGREWVPETRFESIAPFAQLAWTPVEALTLTVGGRIEDASIEVDDYVTIAAAGSTPVGGGDPDFSETLLNAGAIWRLNPSWTLYASGSQGFTMPDVGRVLRAVSTPGRTVDGLIDLKPVVTDNIEAGVEFRRGGLSARVTWFESTADAGALLSSNAVGIFEVQRQRTEIDGIELSVDYAFSDALSIGGNYAWTDGRYDSDGDDDVDSDLDGLNIGPNRLNLYLDGRAAGIWRWRAQLSRLQDRDFDGPAAPPGRDFDGHTLLDLFIAADSHLGTFSLAAENLLDENYFTYFAQTEPAARNDTFFRGNGRTLSLGWQKDF